MVPFRALNGNDGYEEIHKPARKIVSERKKAAKGSSEVLDTKVPLGLVYHPRPGGSQDLESHV